MRCFQGRLQMETERIERAFHRYIHRPDPDQTEDSHELIVCHANVIRYFTCRSEETFQSLFFFVHVD